MAMPPEAHPFPGSVGSAAVGIFLIRSRAMTTRPAATITPAPSSEIGSIMCWKITMENTMLHGSEV